MGNCGSSCDSADDCMTCLDRSCLWAQFWDGTWGCYHNLTVVPAPAFSVINDPSHCPLKPLPRGLVATIVIIVFLVAGAIIIIALHCFRKWTDRTHPLPRHDYEDPNVFYKDVSEPAQPQSQFHSPSRQRQEKTAGPRSLT